MRRRLYLQVEIKSRELLGRILLAAKAVERGWEVYLGDTASIRKWAAKGVPGAYIELSIPDHKAAMLAGIRANDVRVACLCEENVVYPDGEEYCARKMGRAALAHTDLVFASGERNYAHLAANRPEVAERFSITGNPRFDTLLPDLRSVYQPSADAIAKRYGSFLLVNTNFGTVNPYNPKSDYVAGLVRDKMIAGDKHVQFMREFVAYKRAHLAQFKDTLSAIASAKVFERIVVRPHPVENHQAWREWGKSRGVEVAYTGNANAWMLAARAILHTGCTTGIEGLLLDRPAATFQPSVERKFLTLADEASERVTDADTFLDKVAAWSKLAPSELRAAFSPQRSLINSHIANTQPPLASDRMLDALGTLDYTASADGSTPSRGSRLLAYMASIRTARGREKQKFPSLARHEVVTPLKLWAEAGVLRGMPKLERIGGRSFRLS